MTPGLIERLEAAGEGSSPWTLWSEKRPENTKALYRWRIPARVVCGLLLRPEWTEKLALVGMGYDDNEWWPLSPSHWNGYKRTVPTGLEWRLAEEGETEPAWGGLDLLPDPWTGRPPRVSTKTRWIGAPIYEAEGFWLTHRFGSTGTWADVTKLAAAWNERAILKARATQEQG